MKYLMNEINSDNVLKLDEKLVTQHEHMNELSANLERIYKLLCENDGKINGLLKYFDNQNDAKINSKHK